MIYNQLSKTLVPKSPSRAISLVLVDDDERFLQGLRILLNFYKTKDGQKFVVLGEADREQKVINLVEQQKPELILLDLELKQGNRAGISALWKLKQRNCTGKVIVLSSYREDKIIFQAMQAGAWGYVCKDSLAEQLLPAITTVLNDRVYLAPEVATSFFRSFRIQTERARSNCQEIKLTEREQEVLQLLIEGASNQKISEQLYITVATVKAHLTSIFDKFDVKSRTQAIVKAFRLGLV